MHRERQQPGDGPPVTSSVKQGRKGTCRAQERQREDANRTAQLPSSLVATPGQLPHASQGSLRSWPPLGTCPQAWICGSHKTVRILRVLDATPSTRVRRRRVFAGQRRSPRRPLSSLPAQAGFQNPVWLDGRCMDCVVTRTSFPQRRTSPCRSRSRSASLRDCSYHMRPLCPCPVTDSQSSS